MTGRDAPTMDTLAITIGDNDVEIPRPTTEDEEAGLQRLVESLHPSDIGVGTDTQLGAAMFDLYCRVLAFKWRVTPQMARLVDTLVIGQLSSHGAGGLEKLYDAALSGGEYDAEAITAARRKFREEVAQVERDMDLADRALAEFYGES